MSEHVLSILVKAIGAQSAAKDLRGVDAAVSSIGGRASKGLRTFGSNLKSAFTSPLGIIGITGGLFALDGILTHSIEKAMTMGTTVSRLAKISGMGAVGVSELSAAMEHFGIDSETQLRLVGMLEKNVGNLTTTKKKAAAFEKTYGLSLTDASGRVRNANDLILQSADYFNNKSIPAQTKAAGLAKLYGRNWQELVPILSAGKKGIQDAEEEARKFGLTLTKDNIADLQKAKTATREWNTALGGLELQIGLKLIPHLTEMAHVATQFVGSHGKEIVNFFGDAAKFAGEMGSAIHDDVLPVIKGIGDAWGALPADMKKILIAGFAINKLSGGALTGIASDLGRGLIKGVLGMNAGVVNIKAGVVNGAGLPGTGGGTPPVAGPAGDGPLGFLKMLGLGVAAIKVSSDLAPHLSDAQSRLLNEVHGGVGPASGRVVEGLMLKEIAAENQTTSAVEKVRSAVGFAGDQSTTSAEKTRSAVTGAGITAKVAIDRSTSVAEGIRGAIGLTTNAAAHAGVVAKSGGLAAAAERVLALAVGRTDPTSIALVEHGQPLVDAYRDRSSLAIEDLAAHADAVTAIMRDLQAASAAILASAAGVLVETRQEARRRQFGGDDVLGSA